jgi:hypothetical protein
VQSRTRIRFLVDASSALAGSIPDVMLACFSLPGAPRMFFSFRNKLRIDRVACSAGNVPFIFFARVARIIFSNYCN